MSQISENLRILERLAEAFNEHDLDKIMEFFCDDCSLDMPRGSDPWGTRYIGKAAVRKGLQTRFEMLPDVHYEDMRHFATESMGVSEWLVTGKDSYWKIVG
jgi:ketosteroid isomerase-like protein